MSDSPANEHRLFNQLMKADGVTQDEIEELYEDLKVVLDKVFDPFIQEAMVQRACTYVEINSQRLN